ncbi:chymotrypsinogen B-like [Gigantopelta aegis]|uniref:chymotrypsinogen B-like n=1 Tax=Gigantopelta aegis TaxID=1735272 RepID=UPI001B88E59E|nr:chymotrypsinogen B-like [Gigantopelta aegis]
MAFCEISVVFLALISCSSAYYCTLIPRQLCQLGSFCTSGILVPGVFWCPSTMVCCKQQPDIDECAGNTHTCAGSSVCRNIPSSFQCTCSPGFQYTGVTCVDIDECATGTHNCGLMSTCTNNAGSYTCNCGPGYYSSGTQCIEYACGVVGPLRRVNNGQNAAPCAWPWQLSIRRNTVKPNPPSLLTSFHDCAGTLLSPYWFLTTPECILYSAKYKVTSNPQTEAFVVAGDNNINIDEGIEQILTISKIFIHPDYPNVNSYEELTNYFGRFSNTSKQANAFALVKLSTPAVYSDCVKHICLPEPDEKFCEQPCAVTGWGYDSSFSYVSPLQEAYMTVFTADTCKAFDLTILESLTEVHPEKTICAASTNNVWPCLGDDGGPISCKEGNQYVLRGTYSYPDNCGDMVKGISLLSIGDVSKVVTWIKTTMMSN